MALAASLTLLADSVTLLLADGGTELTASRRFIDALDCEAARVQFSANSASVSVRVEYSLDSGGTWATLVAEDAYVGSDPYISGWQLLPPEAAVNNLLLRALGIGTGVFRTVAYIELEYR